VHDLTWGVKTGRNRIWDPTRRPNCPREWCRREGGRNQQDQAAGLTDPGEERKVGVENSSQTHGGDKPGPKKKKIKEDMGK